MKKNGKKYWYAILASILILIFFIGIWYFSSSNISKPHTKEKKDSVTDQDFKYNPDGTVTLGLGMIANGIYDTDSNKIFNNDTTVELKNGKFEGQVRFQQNIERKKNYLLIVLIDFQQHEFFNNGIAFNSYPFTLEGTDEITIDLEVNNLDSSVQDFNYLIVSEPDIRNLSFDDWDTINLTHEFYTWHLFFNNLKPEEKILINTNNETIESKTDYGLQLTKNHDKIIAVPTSISGEKMEIVISNMYDSDVSYAIVPFLNWEQTTFDNGSEIKYINIPAQKTVYFDFELPKVKTISSYQVFAFPQPFNKDTTRIIYPDSSLRTIIQPIE